jgi:hypothetical protein
VTIERLIGALPALSIGFAMVVLIVLMTIETRRENRERKRKEQS